MKPKHALVIGKFYPPHAGHHLLVRTAASVSERVTVVAMASSVESIPLDLRVAWLREVHQGEANVHVVGTHDDHPVDFESDSIWRAHLELMRAAAAGVTSAPIDAVFTSEPYGPELARRLEARHVPVDPDRTLASVSGTRVRGNPVANWEFLEPPVRGWLSRRVVIVGAESTGKTTLAADLAEALRARGGPFGLTRWVPEHGREYTVGLLARTRASSALLGQPPPGMEALPWASEDFVAIAAEQNRLEDEAARHGGPVLVCDTDAFATSVWHERYVGTRSGAVDDLGRVHPIYLLTHPADVPFDQDGLRDGQHLREWMTAVFEERLRSSGRRWSWIRGTRGERLLAALAAIDALLAEGWKLAAPLEAREAGGAKGRPPGR